MTQRTTLTVTCDRCGAKDRYVQHKPYAPAQMPSRWVSVQEYSGDGSVWARCDLCPACWRKIKEGWEK